ncbi:TPA: hypothetical protein P6K61_001877, partial [Staphylococcus aureus]|nr:hypothetical protein [Staphylococcus aureus]
SGSLVPDRCFLIISEEVERFMENAY